MLCSYSSKCHQVNYVKIDYSLLLLFILVFGNQIGSVSSIPTHSNFFRALSRGRQRVSWCQNDPDFCSNPEKNPWGGSVCCFGKFCKDVMADRNHCGVCGHVCGYEFICCDGKCVDVRNDPRHCGGCFEECPSPGRCSYAMCDYGWFGNWNKLVILILYWWYSFFLSRLGIKILKKIDRAESVWLRVKTCNLLVFVLGSDSCSVSM